MKKIRSLSLIVAAVCVASSSFAQVRGGPGGPGPHPQPPRPPVTHGYPQPQPPRPMPPPPRPIPPPNYPQPNYPRPYPQPNYPQSSAPCVIVGYYDGYSTTYQVQDPYRRVIANTPSYADALNIAQSQQRYGVCSGVVYQSQNNTPNYPNPNYPNPNYPSQQSYCQVMTGADAYGRTLYRVLDRAGRIVATTTDYSQAQYISQTDSSCFQYN